MNIKKNKIPPLVYFAAIFSMVFWGMSFVWSMQVFEFYSPLTTIFIRLFISSALLYVILKPLGFIEKISKKHIKLLLLSALFNPFLYFIGENYGLKLTTPTISAVIIATIPVFTPIFTYAFLKERLSYFNFAGIILSFVGVVVMLINKNLTFTIPLAGFLFLLLAVLTAIGYSIFLKKLTCHYSPLTIITYQNMIGFVYMIPVFMIMDFNEFLSITPSRNAIRSLIFLAVFASSGAFIFFTFVIKHLGVNKANVYTNLIPVITAIFSFYILSEQFTMNKLIGMIIVITGVFTSQIRTRNNKIITQ